jgi:hypothetical protein
MANVNKSAIQSRDAQLIAGIQKYLMNVASLSLAGSAITPANLVKLIQGQIDQINAVAATKAKWTDAVEANRALGAQVAPIVRGLRAYVLNTYGSGTTTLADFGFSPPKTAEKTPKVKVAAAVKAKATRTARHTMGKVQKKEVTGGVTGVTVTATTAGSTPVAPAPATTTPAAPTTPPAPAAGGAVPGGTVHSS